MGQQQSKDELLYEQVQVGNLVNIRALHQEGAGLEWMDKDGKTPLIMACMNPHHFDVAEMLIELGANVNAYRPGRHAGTPLHHAAKRGLAEFVQLLLFSGGVLFKFQNFLQKIKFRNAVTFMCNSHYDRMSGKIIFPANALVRNDDCHSPLDTARLKGHTNVVRTIENHICLFSGWLREFHGPGFLEALVPQLLSRKVCASHSFSSLMMFFMHSSWAVLIPCGSHVPGKPLKLQLALYSALEDAQPRTTIALWKAKIEELKLGLADPQLIIYDNSTKTRYKLAAANEGDRLQIQCLYDACRGISVLRHRAHPSSVPQNPESSPSAMAQTGADAAKLAAAIGFSVRSAAANGSLLTSPGGPEGDSTNGWGNPAINGHHAGWDLGVGGHLQPKASSSGWSSEPASEEYNGWAVSEPANGNNPVQHDSQDIVPTAAQIDSAGNALVSVGPSAPPVTEEIIDQGTIHYPSIDLSPGEFSASTIDVTAPRGSKTSHESSSSCVICWEAPIEGACVPCGHMAGCMLCLNEIKARNGVCPVCRGELHYVMKLYAV